MRQWIKWVTGFLALSVIMVMIGAVFSKLDEKKGNGGISPVAATEVDRPVTVVIDAGHGGEDGGCIGADGTLEKDLNLAVAAELCDILQASGINAVLIRDEDKMLYDMYGDLESYETYGGGFCRVCEAILGKRRRDCLLKIKIFQLKVYFSILEIAERKEIFVLSE